MISYIWAKLFKKIRGKAVKNSQIDKTSVIESGSHLVNVNMDRYSYCGYDCTFINVDIGSFCSISDNVIIGGATHPIEWVSTSPIFRKRKDSIKRKFAFLEYEVSQKTTIGHDVWIGTNVLVKQGVKIGNGAIVGMGSVVTKDVDPYTIVAGNPAKEIRKRFPDEIIQVLQKSQWWTYSESSLLEIGSKFDDINAFVEYITEVKKSGRK